MIDNKGNYYVPFSLDNFSKCTIEKLNRMLWYMNSVHCRPITVLHLAKRGDKLRGRYLEQERGACRLCYELNITPAELFSDDLIFDELWYKDWYSKWVQWRKEERLRNELRLQSIRRDRVNSGEKRIQCVRRKIKLYNKD